jgi:hypothetical protein
MNYRDVLTALFSNVALVVVTGVWKIGKTNIALRIAEDCLKFGIIDRVASNIETEDGFDYISTLDEIKIWAASDSSRKLYILDELGMHMPKRRAMSSINNAILLMLPEASKYRFRLIVIIHSLSLIDSAMLDPVWFRGEVQKISLKCAVVKSTLLPGGEARFKNVPETTVKYDPYKIAPFHIHAEAPFGDEELNILWRYCHGEKVEKLVGDDRKKLSRLVKEYLQKTMEKNMGELASESKD